MAPTYIDTLDTFASFLTAYAHTVLCLRNLYPRTSFLQSRFHNTAVFQSRHPLVCEWVRDAVSAVREELLNGTVARIAVVVFSYGGEKSGSARIMERYMFDVSSLPVIDKNERNVQLAWDNVASGPEQSDANASEAEDSETAKPQTRDADDIDVNTSEQFRAALITLTTRTAQLSPLPPKCSFNISIELKDEADVDPPIGHPQPWIPVQPSLQKTGRKGAPPGHNDDEVLAEGQDLGGMKVTPIRNVEAGVFRFDTWIEEGQAKLSAREKSSVTAAMISPKIASG